MKQRRTMMNCGCFGTGIRGRKMNPTFKRIIKSVIGSIIIAILIFIVLLVFAPNATAFGTNNYGWNGLHEVSTSFSLKPINSFSAIPTANGHEVLLVISPTSNFTQSDANNALDFVRRGGTLVITDTTGTANSLLGGMGVNIRIENNYVVNDPTFNWKTPSLPIALVEPLASQTYPFLSGVRGIALDLPSPLATSSAARVVAISSSSSYTTIRSNSSQQALAGGPFALIAAESIGSGVVFVVGGSTLFTSSVWTIADNKVLTTQMLSGNSTVFLDTSHWPSNTGDSFKSQLEGAYAVFSLMPLRYLLSLGFVVISIILLPVITTVASARPSSASKRARAESEYNVEILNRIRRDRKKYGIE